MFKQKSKKIITILHTKILIIWTNIRPEFFISSFTGFFFSDLVSGDEKNKEKSFENYQLTGHFQSFFFL